MTNPFLALPTPLRVHILLHVACQADDRTAMRMACVFPAFNAFLKENQGARLELMDALATPTAKVYCVVWCFCSKYHRGDDLPAIEWANGYKEWWLDGKRHRSDDLPAIESLNGSKEWWLDGKRHRGDDLPAIEWTNGYKEWWLDGVRQPASL